MNDETEYKKLTNVIANFMNCESDNIDLRRTVNSLFYGILIEPQSDSFNPIRIEAEKTTLVKLIKKFADKNLSGWLDIKKRIIDEYNPCFHEYDIRVDLIIDFDDNGSVKPTFFVLLVNKITKDRYNKYNLESVIGLEHIFEKIIRVDEDLHRLFKCEFADEISILNYEYGKYVDEFGGLEKYNSIRTERKRY
jgi:hypothetical protein